MANFNTSINDGNIKCTECGSFVLPCYCPPIDQKIAANKYSPSSMTKYAGEDSFNVGDKVIKDSGDYTFEGIVVAAFYKLSGAPRYVVEDNRGILHVYSFKNLKLVK